MRIVIDLQSVQGESRKRGIGRYSLALAQAMAKVGKDHEIWIALSGLFPDTIERIRGTFEGLVSPQRIVVWEAPGPVAAHDPANTWRREAAELIRESFLASLRPDILHVSSVFEGWVDNSVTSVGKGPENVLTSVTVYDLIPLIFEHIYLLDPQIRSWYYQKLQWLKNADLWLAISECTRQDVIERLALPEDWVVNISAGRDPRFRPMTVDPPREASLRTRYGIDRAFVMYTGGIDPRKNIEGLIKAFASISRDLRKTYQLVIVCEVQEHDRRRLTELAKRSGLRERDVVITGFVPDEDLVVLYNLCALFVFPSLYEGFGLPPLEAMACGAPVIASNTSSLPEVVGWEKALFDPKDPGAIAEKMEEALTNEAFREDLRKHGLEQAKRFSWEESAHRALKAFETFHAECVKAKPYIVKRSLSKPKLAYVSPLPPAKSGIADYSRELLPELAKYYQIELIVDQPEVSDPWLTANFPIRTAEWFDKHAGEYDRILYHFGNSEWHKHIFNLLERHPGVVVLHDFYLSNVLHWMDCTGYASGIFRKELYRSHGWGALVELAKSGEEAVVWKYPCNLSVIRGAEGIIVHSQHAKELANAWYGKGTSQEWQIIPQPYKIPPSSERSSARDNLGLRSDDFLICSFGFFAPTKLPEIILEGWLESNIAHNPRCRLVFVGHFFDQELEAKIKERAKQAGVADRVQITGHVPREIYERYLAAADVAVQLRTKSRGETARTVLDCLAWGLPTVVNAHGWLAELPNHVVLKIPDAVRPSDVAEALEKLYQNPDLRRRLGEAGRAYVKETCSPGRVAAQYFQAIERFAENGPHARRRRLIRSIAQINSPCLPSEEDVTAAAVAIATNLNHGPSVPQLLVDVSELAEHDARTGFQRVTRAHLKNLLQNPPEGWRVEPVYAAPPSTYRYARVFMATYFGFGSPYLLDDAVEVNHRDIFLGLDLNAGLVPKSLSFFTRAKAKNMRIYFMLYDLLPVHYPHFFSPEMHSLFLRWLETIVPVADGIVCISRSTADQLIEWLETRRPSRTTSLNVGFVHLGADVESASAPEEHTLNPQVQAVLSRGAPVFLMVGTIEPRKGYAQALAAFEQLWQSGIDISLIIVGRQGWMVESLVERLRTHPERNRRLFWLEGASDATLLALYQESTALLMASQNEGFGLPLIEAARCGLPIIARDIPVFREICGDHAFYFQGNKPEDLAEAIQTWLKLHQSGRAPSVKGMKVLTWAESTQQLLDTILNERWYRVWEPK